MSNAVAVTPNTILPPKQNAIIKTKTFIVNTLNNFSLIIALYFYVHVIIFMIDLLKSAISVCIIPTFIDNNSSNFIGPKN